MITVENEEEVFEKFPTDSNMIDGRALMFDVIMRRKNGKEVCVYKEIRKQRPEMKALFMCGSNSQYNS